MPKKVPKRKVSLSWKMTAIVVIVVLISLTLLSYSDYQAVKADEYIELEEKTDIIANWLKSALGVILANENMTTAQRVVEINSKIKGIQDVVIVDESNTILAAKNEEEIGQQFTLHSPEEIMAFNETTRVEHQEEGYYHVIVPITAVLTGPKSGRLGTVVLSLDTASINEKIQDRMVQEFSTNIIFAVILGALILIVFRKTLIEPINALHKYVEETSQGKKVKLLEFKSRDELTDLAHSFSEIFAEVKKAEKVQEKYSKELEKNVATRTKELQANVDELNKSKEATMNLLEDLNEVNARLKQANKELRELDTLKDEFISMTSHELKTPLIALKGYTDLLLEGELGKVSKEQKESLTIISRNATRLKKLIEDILEIARLESGRYKMEKKKINLSNVVKTSLQDLENFAQKNQVKLSENIPANLSLEADEGKISRVVINLLSNAIKFTPPGGKVEINAARQNGRVKISVKDTGIGISKADQPKIFQKFVQIDSPQRRKHGGTGLGLAICQRLVEIHKGSINVESALGKGSNFYFTLPMKG